VEAERATAYASHAEGLLWVRSTWHGLGTGVSRGDSAPEFDSVDDGETLTGGVRERPTLEQETRCRKYS
jgi:hypothetical protein